MKIVVNNKEMEISSSTTIRQLATNLELPALGTAIAVNNKMIPRSAWEETILQENDQVVIIKAACGG